MLENLNLCRIWVIEFEIKDRVRDKNSQNWPKCEYATGTEKSERCNDTLWKGYLRNYICTTSKINGLYATTSSIFSLSQG